MQDDGSKVTITSEDDKRLVIQTSEGKEETYYLNPIRTMWLQIAELQICSRAHSYSLAPETDIMPDLKPCVAGTAWLQSGSISVIGEPSNVCRSLQITIKAHDEADRQKLIEDKKGGKKLRCTSVGFSRRDWEIGNEDTWFIEAWVSQQTLDTIMAGLSNGSLQEMTLGLSLDRIYSDDNFSHSGADWFLRPSRQKNSFLNPELAWGEVSSMSLALTEADLRPKEEPEPVDEQDEEIHSEETAPDYHLLALSTLAGNVEKLRGTVKWVGGFIAGLLLLLVMK